MLPGEFVLPQGWAYRPMPRSASRARPSIYKSVASEMFNPSTGSGEQLSFQTHPQRPTSEVGTIVCRPSPNPHARTRSFAILTLAGTRPPSSSRSNAMRSLMTTGLLCRRENYQPGARRCQKQKGQSIRNGRRLSSSTTALLWQTLHHCYSHLAIRPSTKIRRKRR
jgi:hypothetical protein